MFVQYNFYFSPTLLFLKVSLIYHMTVQYMAQLNVRTISIKCYLFAIKFLHNYLGQLYIPILQLHWCIVKGFFILQKMIIYDVAPFGFKQSDYLQFILLYSNDDQNIYFDTFYSIRILCFSSIYAINTSWVQMT